MPEIDRKGDTLIISGIPGDKMPRTIPIDSEDARGLINELANEFQTTPLKILEQLEDKTIEL